MKRPFVEDVDRVLWASVALGALIVAGILLVNCTHVPIAGEACKDSDAYCAEQFTAFSCRDGKLAPFSCNGPKGCMLGAERAVMCDQSKGSTAGQPCFQEYEGKGQCSGTDLLECTHGTWAKVPCPDGTSCQASGMDLVCK